MTEILSEAIRSTSTIIVFVFVMMLLVDYINVLTRGSLSAVMKKGRLRQYASASFLGATPGCLGAFMVVSFYVHGLISFGSTLACMISSSGDEAYFMLALFPRKAFLLFAILFVMGIGFGWSADAVSRLFRFRHAEGCRIDVFHAEEECRCFDRKLIWQQLKGMSPQRAFLLAAFAAAIFSAAAGVFERDGWEGKTTIVLAAIGGVLIGTVPDHYLRTHIIAHIVKKHLGKIALWTFFALLAVSLGQKYWDLDSFVSEHTTLVILIAGLVGLVPQSGPHLIFVTMFAENAVPFSVLLTNSIVQDGHALLPLLSYSVRDALTIKAIKLPLALVIGLLLHAFGW